MRNTYKNEEKEDDFILSPVKDNNGNFFDSSKVIGITEPRNADSNGAYHIALKGLKILHNIRDGKITKDTKNNSSKDWFDFVQQKKYLKE